MKTLGFSHLMNVCVFVFVCEKQKECIRLTVSLCYGVDVLKRETESNKMRCVCVYIYSKCVCVCMNSTVCITI